jgi:hypothetical protein
MQRLLDHRILRVLLFLAGFAMALEGCNRDRLSQLVLNVSQTSQGYAATFDIGLENG